VPPVVGEGLRDHVIGPKTPKEKCGASAHTHTSSTRRTPNWRSKRSDTLL